MVIANLDDDAASGRRRSQQTLRRSCALATLFHRQRRRAGPHLERCYDSADQFRQGQDPTVLRRARPLEQAR
jgi:hypothetical protein